MHLTELQKLVRLANSAERAAGYAYVGHAWSVGDKKTRAEIREIELDEWQHRKYLEESLDLLQVKPSKYLEFKFSVIGKVIGLSCLVIGKFMPNYFAGRLESANVNEYLEMARLALDSPLREHIGCILEMAVVEKRHELYFLSKVQDDAWLKLFQTIFKWGKDSTFNPIGNDFSIPQNA